MAFGKRDVVTAGYPEAVRAARAGGFEAIEGVAGGRAAVFHEDTIAFAHATPDADPRSRIDERFEATADADGGGARPAGRGRPRGRGPRRVLPRAPTA